VDTTLFLGRYARTPFGVHLGQMDVLTVPAVGTKSFRLWSPEYVSTHLGLMDLREYPEYIEGSYRIDCSPGDVGYWPSREWHIAESEGVEFTAAWGIGFWQHPDDFHSVRRVTEALVGLLKARNEHRGEASLALESGGPQGRLSRYPDQWRRVSRDLVELIEKGELDAILDQEWGVLRSARGVKDVPPPFEAPLVGETDWLEAVPEAVLLCGAAREGGLHVAANGHVLLLPDSAAIRLLLERIRPGFRFSVKDLCAAGLEAGGEPADEVSAELCAAIRLLVRTRVLRTVHTGGPVSVGTPGRTPAEP
jgi:hypothetical protein